MLLIAVLAPFAVMVIAIASRLIVRVQSKQQKANRLDEVVPVHASYARSAV